jgi:hypothetical protein
MRDRRGNHTNRLSLTPKNDPLLISGKKANRKCSEACFRPKTVPKPKPNSKEGERTEF